jgi:mRNA-degrading endonuclease HigB of HigAB toxin-antitoxin module
MRLFFENNLKNLPFEQFLAIKYKLNNYLTREFWITIDGDKYKLIVYENSEFDKYFGFSNFAVQNQENIANIVGGQPKFIAISMINEFNEDCLSNKSMFQNKSNGLS